MGLHSTKINKHEQIVVRPPDGMLLRNKKKQIIDIQDNINESQTVC